MWIYYKRVLNDDLYRALFTISYNVHLREQEFKKKKMILFTRFARIVVPVKLTINFRFINIVNRIRFSLLFHTINMRNKDEWKSR